jgi:uncharacterized membrane protein
MGDTVASCSKKIKSQARDRLLGNYGTLIGALLIQLLLIYVLSFMVASVFNSFIMYIFVIFLIELVGGILSSGSTYMYMRVTYGKSIRVSDLWAGFGRNADKAIIIRVPSALISAVSQAAFIMYVNGFIANSTLYAVLITFLLILQILCGIFFGQALFLMWDFPDRSALNLMKTSARIIKGNISRYILLNLSFIPMILLGCATLFIPLLWVECYILASRASFYKELIAQYATR